MIKIKYFFKTAAGGGAWFAALYLAGMAQAYAAAPLAWQDCRQPAFKNWFSAEAPPKKGLQCAVLTVPLSYQPDDINRQRPVTLALTRLPAGSHSMGSILMIAGGPGESSLLPNVAGSPAVQKLLRHYDVVGYAPRGVAPSVPVIACPMPDDAEPAGYGQAFTASCVRHMGADTLAYVGTREAVDDVESIRRALGVPQLNLVSYSYGTKVAALYTGRYPSHVRAAVLDGVVDLAEDALSQRITQEQGYQQTFERFAAWCAQHQPRCPLAAAPDEATRRWHALLGQLDRRPLRDKHGEAIDGEALSGLMVETMLWREDWPPLAKAITGLQHGRSRDYNRLKYRAPPSANDDALTVINCADSALPLPLDEEIRQLRRIDATSPFNNHRHKSDAELLEPCSHWPHRGTDITHTPKPDAALPKLLFVAQRHDAATPYRNAQAMAAALNSHLLTRNDDGHTLALQDLSACVDRQVVAYLLDPARFTHAEVCEAGQ